MKMKVTEGIKTPHLSECGCYNKPHVKYCPIQNENGAYINIK